jgi:hypothetical protein
MRRKETKDKGLAFLRLSANKLNTFHENTLPDNIVNGLKTLNLASNPYMNLMAHWYAIGQVYEAKDRNEIFCQDRMFG